MDEGHCTECPSCPRSFGRKSDLRDHLAVAHRGERHTCLTCLKKYKSKYGLRMHELLHTDTPNHLCEQLHTDTPNHLCSHWGRGYAYRSAFEAHMADHTGEEPFTCGRCNHHFTQHSHLCTQTHLWHNGKVLQVFSCNKCFKAKPYLKEHEKGHFTPNRFQCVSCGVFFKSRVDCSSNHAEHYHTQSKHQYSFDAPSKNSYCSIWWKWVCLKWPQMLMIYICQQLVVFLGFSDGHCLMCVTFKRLPWSVKNKDVVLMLSRLQRWWCGKC